MYTMSHSRKIYSKGKIELSDKNVEQKVKYNRTQLLSAETAAELNTYLNFGVFPTFADTYVPRYEDGKLIEYSRDSKVGVGTPGVRSIFNKAGTIILGSRDGDYKVDVTDGDSVDSWRIGNNVPLMDSPKARQRIRMSSGCSVKELVAASGTGELGQETYSYSDFMYCKHLGKVSNNYMVTLRRFPLPVDDFIGSLGETLEERLQKASHNVTSIGCMVTWMGVSGNDMNSLLKYNFKMPFKEETAEFQDKNVDADQNQGIMNGLFCVFDEKYQKQYQDGFAGEAANKALSHFGISGLGDPPYKNHAKFRDEKTKVYGPIDSVRTTYLRADKGLEFNQSLTLVFEYELRSYNGINAKQAMLDLISNILNVTYTSGSFWGGGIKGFGAHQSNIFANLNIFKARGGFTNFIDAFSADLQTAKNKMGEITANGDWKKMLKNIVNNLGGMIMSGMLNKLGRPQKAMYNALLSPAPIGFWHVTIGNPKRPIMSIGNMVITNTTVEHTGPLGLDDFPTGLKVTVELSRGKPRDLRDIEKLYMQGNDRIYTSMGDKVFDMYRNSQLYKDNRSDLSKYNPVVDIAEVSLPTDNRSEPKVTVKEADFNKIQDSLKKFFGTTDTYSIYIPAAEQEYGSGKQKPSTRNNKSITGKDNGK